jgi:type IV secretory pathway TrbD component
MIARIALVFHVFEGAPGSMVMSVETLQKAVNLVAQLRKHSVALFTDILGRSPSTEVARALARSLAAADPSLTTVGRDWMTQHCRAFERAKDDRTRREAVQLLEDLDWLRDVSTRTYGGWPTKLEVNGNIFRLYAREGEAHRAQRAAVQALFEDQPPG